MNYSGSSRKLIGNAISAILAAIEIYNKPRFPYRDEVTVVLLANAWELLFKAVVSKSKQSIYYPKRRHEPYKTLSLDDAAKRAILSNTWPSSISGEAVRKNVELITLYRDNAVHFYNEDDFGVILYSLAQTAIYNFRDVASVVFKKDIADEMSWQIIPLGVRSPIEPIDYLKAASDDVPYTRSQAVRGYLSELKRAEGEIQALGVDSGRLLTLYSVTLQSQKKITNADIVVGVSSGDDSDAVVIQKKVDPNETHPYRQKDVLERLPKSLGINSYKFQAITNKYNLRDNDRYCWTDSTVNLVKWSRDIVPFIKELSKEDIAQAIEYHSAQRGSKRAGDKLD